jgi:oxygen-independent coproporphyrinogen-3 oxidase
MHNLFMITQPTQAGLYIHIPFCLSKCGYCSFYSISSTHLLPEFIKAIVQEMAFYKNIFKSFDTVYIGGGTPSLLSGDQLAEIFAAINKIFKIDKHAEITIEVNPGDVSPEYFRFLHKLDINRLNIGIQSFEDSILKFLGRRHTARDALSAISNARKAGFENIGIDLIYGVHGQNVLSWKKNIQKALSFSPEHISCYQLSLEKTTPTFKLYKKENMHLLSEDEALDFFLITDQLLEDAGFLHYEVSNFARDDNLKSRHNTKYWQHTPYLGLGPAAHSFIGRKRWWNKSSVNTYIHNIAGGKMPVEDAETLSVQQLQLEALFLGMRTKDGIDLQLFKRRYGSDLVTDKKDTIDMLVKNKLVELKNDVLRPTLAGMAVADSLALI